jgi:hypothetical protein
MKLICTVIVLFFLAPGALAQIPRAFCWAMLENGLHCTSIGESPAMALQARICKRAADLLGSKEHGLTRSTDRKFLEIQQEENCNYVNGLPRYECLRQARCEKNGEILVSTTPIGRAVFLEDAGDGELARKACLLRAPDAYVLHLNEEGPDCLIGAKAALTVAMPRTR